MTPEQIQDRMDAIARRIYPRDDMKQKFIWGVGFRDSRVAAIQEQIDRIKALRAQQDALYLELLWTEALRSQAVHELEQDGGGE